MINGFTNTKITLETLSENKGWAYNVKERKRDQTFFNPLQIKTLNPIKVEVNLIKKVTPKLFFDVILQIRINTLKQNKDIFKK